MTEVSCAKYEKRKPLGNVSLLYKTRKIKWCPFYYISLEGEKDNYFNWIIANYGIY